MVEISIVIVTFNSSKDIEDALDSIFSHVKVLFEVIIVDNNSSDNTLKVVGQFPEVKIIKNEQNMGFAFANNQAFRIAQGKFILVFNPDLIITPHTCLERQIEILKEDPTIGLVAPRLLYTNGEIQESARGFPSPLIQLIRMLRLDRFYLKADFYKKYILDINKISEDTSVDWVIGAFMLIPKESLFKVGLFNAAYFMYFEDVDLCLKLKRQGLLVCYTPRFSAVHRYKRESVKKVFSKLKWIHFKSAVRFYTNSLFT